MSGIRGDVDAALRQREMKLKEELDRSAERLKKLWDAYELQEKDIAALKERITFLEGEGLHKDGTIESQNSAMEARDTRLRELEIEVHSLRKFKEEAEPKVRSLESQLRAAEDRYTKLFKFAESVAESAKFWHKASDEKDAWFDRNIGSFGDFKRALDERDQMLARLHHEASELELAAAARKASLQAAQQLAAKPAEPEKK